MVRDMRISQEPNLKEWVGKEGGRLFTCGRPGRWVAGFEKSLTPVPEKVILEWVKTLPKADVVHLVSLLGHKSAGKNVGTSEFVYYPFRSATEASVKPMFQDWLNDHCVERFAVHEFPTVDARGIKKELMNSVESCLLELLRRDQTVIVIDSAGEERTARVCENIGYKKA